MTNFDKIIILFYISEWGDSVDTDIQDRKKQIGAVLKMLRNRENLTQEYVAALISKGRSAYAYYEKGDVMPSYDTLVKLARIYRVPMSVFDGNTDTLNSDRPNYIEEFDSGLAFSDLSHDEEELVLIFRSKTRAEKQEIIEYMKNKK